jgi:hypothetical protein
MSISTQLPETMSPDERRAEIADLLARGVLRGRADRHRLANSDFRLETVATCLESRPPIRLSVPTG